MYAPKKVGFFLLRHMYVFIFYKLLILYGYFYGIKHAKFMLSIRHKFKEDNNETCYSNIKAL